MKGNEQLKEYGKRLRLYHLCNHMDELLHVAQQDKPTSVSYTHLTLPTT